MPRAAIELFPIAPGSLKILLHDSPVGRCSVLVIACEQEAVEVRIQAGGIFTLTKRLPTQEVVQLLDQLMELSQQVKAQLTGGT